MKKITHTWLSALCFLSMALGPLAAQALPFSSLVIFGDSLSDSGNNAVVFDTQALGRTPTPIDSPAFIPILPYQSDRYSNGPVWVEQFAASLGMSAKASLLGGTNFAFGGATSGPGGSSFPFSLTDQVSAFLGGTGGVAAGGALYVVQGGGNDALDAFALAAGGGDPSSIIAAYAANMAAIITSLARAGAEEFLLVNTPDIGLTPTLQSFGPAAAGLGSGIAAAMNSALDLTL
ncbi:MAG: SGNH/GDSL hydrolase family protein, partial [Burkholderiales bacterium]